MDFSPGAPCFFKVFLPEHSSQYLTIPPAFRRHLELEAQQPNGNRIISLQGPSGRTWCVNLVTNSKGLCFHKGWKEFVADHSLQHGDFLVFHYDRSFHFTILLFDTTACQKKSAFSASPSKEGIVIPDESDGVTPLRKRDESDGVTPLRKRKRDGSLAKKNHCRKDSDCRGSPNWFRKELSPEEEITIDCAAAVNRHDVVKELQFIALRSRRREVTEQEMDKAFEKAESFKSENPFVKVVMRGSYVYNNFNMHLPRQFAREHISMENKRMTLWDDNGKPWMMNYTTNNMRGRFNGACWRKFSYAHNLELGDVCVFELIGKNQFKVHIFRVVEALVPLFRVPRKFKSICEN